MKELGDCTLKSAAFSLSVFSLSSQDNLCWGSSIQFCHCHRAGRSLLSCLCKARRASPRIPQSIFWCFNFLISFEAFLSTQTKNTSMVDTFAETTVDALC